MRSLIHTLIVVALYDLSKDRCEAKNLASGNPERVRDLADMWKKQFDEIAALAATDLSKESTSQEKE